MKRRTTQILIIYMRIFPKCGISGPVNILKIVMQDCYVIFRTGCGNNHIYISFPEEVFFLILKISMCKINKIKITMFGETILLFIKRVEGGRIFVMQISRLYALLIVIVFLNKKCRCNNIPLAEAPIFVYLP